MNSFDVFVIKGFAVGKLQTKRGTQARIVHTRLFCRFEMNCTNTELYSFRWNFAENPVFFSFLVVLVLVGVVLRWALRSYNTTLPDISKNIVTFLNAYIVEFFFGMLLVVVRLKCFENIFLKIQF